MNMDVNVQLQLLMNSNWQQGTCVCNVNDNVAMGTEQQMKANTLYCIVNRFTIEPKQEKCCSLYFEFARNPTRPHFDLNNNVAMETEHWSNCPSGITLPPSPSKINWLRKFKEKNAQIRTYKSTGTTCGA